MKYLRVVKSSWRVIKPNVFFAGTVLFSSKSGSGGGAVELIAVNGTLTIGEKEYIYIYNTV